jgi:streptogramin lyase
MRALIVVCLLGLVAVANIGPGPVALGSLHAANSSVAPVAIARGADGNLWFTEFNGGHIGRVTPAGAISAFRLPVPLSTQGLATGPDGNMWFGAGLTQIGRITPSGQIRLFALRAGIAC